MTPFRFLLAACALVAASQAMATPSPATYNLQSAPSATTGGSGTSGGTSFNGGSYSAYCTKGTVGCAAGGTNYGNTYTWNQASTGNGPKVTMTAWGTTSLSTSATIQKAWIGDYGSYGFGVTSQSPGELTGNHMPDQSSPHYQHAMDNYSAYESLMFSFASAVTLSALNVGFVGSRADATILEYKGAGNPTTKLASGESYADLLSNGWVVVTNLLNLGQYSSNAFGGGTASQYWMVGAYLPIGGNKGSYVDSFKVTGFVAARAVPEPATIALFLVASAALVAARRRRAQRI